MNDHATPQNFLIISTCFQIESSKLRSLYEDMLRVDAQE